MKVILNQDVAGLGEEGDIKEVAGGYARNYLLPKKLALPYTKQNIAHLGARRATIEQRKDEKRREAMSIKERLESEELVFTMPAGESGKLFGSVNNAMVVQELENRGYSIEKKRVAVIFVLFIFSALFWSGFEQAGSSLNLVAERLTDRVYFGWEMPASWFQSVNPLWIITLAPVFAWLWVKLGKYEPSSPAKFAIGLILMGSGFLVLVWATAIAQTGVEVSPMWLVVTYLLHTCGELSLSPVGLSMVTKLAPKRMVGQMMGVWFMSISLGNLMAGLVAGYFEAMALPTLFGAVAATAIGGGLILFLLVPMLRKLMSGVH